MEWCLVIGMSLGGMLLPQWTNAMGGGESHIPNMHTVLSTIAFGLIGLSIAFG